MTPRSGAPPVGTTAELAAAREVFFARRRRSVIALLLLSALLAGTTAAQWVIWTPATTEPSEVDAIVVLAYGNDRVERGRELAAAGVSDVLVLSMPEVLDEWIAEGRALPEGTDHWLEECASQYPDYLALCFHPDPQTTEGEAVALQALAAQQGWESIALVTELSHLGRATMIFERCFTGEVHPVTSDSAYPWWYNVFRGAYEMAAYVKDFFRTSAC